MLLGILAVGAVCAATWLISEGLYAIAQRGQSDTSITHKTYILVREQIIKGLKLREASDPAANEGPPYTRVLQADDIEDLLPELKEAGVAIGNVPYSELMSADDAINMDDGDCLTQKPHVDKVMTFLRTHAFKPFDPPNLFYDRRADLPPKIRKLIDTYGVRLVAYTTNEYGERITVPAVGSNRKVLIAGDSVANGTGIDDSETISSQLQAFDPERQYINLGIAGADAPDIICALKKAAERYPHQIDELIYVYCENDFDTSVPYGTPEAVVAWLKDFADTQGIAKVTVIYAPFIYNVVPQSTRFRFHAGDFSTSAQQRAALALLAGEAGFRYMDIGDLAMAEADRTKTPFGALSLFSDHVHLSPYGTARLVEQLRLPNSSLSGQIATQEQRPVAE